MADQYDIDDILKEFGRESPEPQRKMEREIPSGHTIPEKKENHSPAIHEFVSERTKPETDRQPSGAAFSRKTAGNSRQRKKLIPLIVISVILLLLSAAGIVVTKSEKIYPNVTASEIPLGGMTQSEAEEILLRCGWKEREKDLTVSSWAELEVNVSPVRAGFIAELSRISEMAVGYGRSGNIYSNLFSYVRSLFTAADINSLAVSPDETYISDVASELADKLETMFGESSVSADYENAVLICIKNGGYLHADRKQLENMITSALKNGESFLEYLPDTGTPVCPDFNAVYAESCTEPQNARYTDDGTRQLIEEKPGYRFNVMQAESLWQSAAAGETVKIPMEVISAPVTAQYLESLQFHDLLGAVTTKYNNSNENRSSNVRLASSKINGTVLYPGDEFSFNAVVGERTEEAGFLMAPAYAGYGDIKDELGGGVCQVSTGVYAAALFSFLKITSHTCHIYPPNYIQLGMDATVSIPAAGRKLDLKIVNDKLCPVKIISYCTETVDEASGKPRKSVTVEIWGTLEPDDYMPVEFDNSYSDIYDYDRVIEPAYPDREGYKIKFTHDENEFEDDTGKGLRTATHRKVYDSSGNLVEDKIINPTYSAGYALDTYYYRG